MKTGIRAAHLRFAGSLLSAGLFLAGAIFLGKEYGDYRRSLVAVDQLEAQVRVQRKVWQEQETEITAMKTADDFVAEAQRLGLTSQGWQKFQVSVNRGGFFADIADLLGQARNTDAYYFLPSEFKVARPEKEKKAAQSAQTPAKPTPKAQAETAGPKPENEDLQVMVNGVFLVKKQ